MYSLQWQGCQKPPRLQILKIDGEGMIDDVIMRGTWRHVCKKCSLILIITNLEMRGKDVVGIVTFDLIGLLPTNHIIILQGHVGVYEETFDANMKIAQTTRNTIAEILLSKRQVCRRNGKLRRLSRRFHTLIWRPGDMVQNLESHARIIRERWWHCNDLKQEALSLIPYRWATP